MKQTKTLELAQTALLSALIVLLAFVPYIGYIKLPILAIQATTIHIPVIIGSVVLGPKKGAFLGGLFQSDKQYYPAWDNSLLLFTVHRNRRRHGRKPFGSDHMFCSEDIMRHIALLCI